MFTLTLTVQGMSITANIYLCGQFPDTVLARARPPFHPHIFPARTRFTCAGCAARNLPVMNGYSHVGLEGGSAFGLFSSSFLAQQRYSRGLLPVACPYNCKIYRGSL